MTGKDFLSLSIITKSDTFYSLYVIMRNVCFLEEFRYSNNTGHLVALNGYHFVKPMSLRFNTLYELLRFLTF